MRAQDFVFESREPIDFDRWYGRAFKITDNNGDSDRPGFSIVTPLNGAAWHWRERPEFKQMVKQKLNDPGWLSDHKYQQIISSMRGERFDPQKHTKVNEVNAPGELAVDEDLIARFTDRGWQVLGEGQDQIVLAKPGSNTVLKIVGAGSLPRQAEIRRYVEFFRANQKNPHYPRVGPDRELDWKGKKYYAYTQERLQALPGDEAVLDYLEDAMAAWQVDSSVDERDIPDGLTYEQMEGLAAAMDRMFRAGFSHVGYDMANVYNLMQRPNGQLVIVDPFSSLDDELAENKITENVSDEAWELVGSTVPEIRKFVTDLGLDNDENSVTRLTPVIPALPDRQISPAAIAKLKNLTADHISPGHDANILQGIKKISGAPNAREQYIKLMTLRDRQEVNLPGRQARQRGYDLGRLFDAVKAGQYESPVLLRLPTGLYAIGGRTRLYAALAAGIPARVKVIDGGKLQAGSQEVKEVKILSQIKGKGSEPSQLPRFGRPIEPEKEEYYLGKKVGSFDGYQVWKDWVGGQLGYHLFDPRERRVVITTFGSQYKGNPNSYIIHGLYAAPGNPVKAHQFYRNLIIDQGLTLISDRKQSPGGNKVWQKLEAYPDVTVYGYDTKTGEMLNFGARDSEMYAIPARAAKNPETKYIANNLRLVATASKR